MTTRWSTWKPKVKLQEPAVPSFKRRDLISPEPLVSVISKVYEQTSSILNFINGKQSKNLQETEAIEGSKACFESDITFEGQFSGKNSMSDQSGVLEKFWKLGKETVGGLANRTSEIFLNRRVSEFKSSEVSRNHHVCADLNGQSNSNQWSNNLSACTGRFSCDFSDYTPAPFIDAGSQISKRPDKETPSTTFSLFLQYIKGFFSLSSPLDTAINFSVEGESSLQPESVKFEGGKDEGSLERPRKRQRKEAISSTCAAMHCSTMEYVDHEVQERWQMVDSIGEAHDSATTEMLQHNLSEEEEPSMDHGGDAAGGSGNGSRSESGSGNGSGTSENDGGGDSEGAVDGGGGGGGGGGGDHAQVALQAVIVYANSVIVGVISVTEHQNLEWLRGQVHHILRGVGTGQYQYYGYNLFYKKVLNSPQENVNKQLFPVGSLLGDPSWTTDPWEKLVVDLTEVRAMGIPKVVEQQNGVRIPVKCSDLPEQTRLNVGVNLSNLAEKIPGRVAITVNGSLMNYYDFRHTRSLQSLIREVYDLLREHEYWDYLNIYGCEFSYLSKHHNLELFPSSIWSNSGWNRFLERLSEIRVRGRRDIFWRLECELGRLSLAATSGFLHEYITSHGSLRGYFTRGRHGGRRRSHLFLNPNPNPNPNANPDL